MGKKSSISVAAVLALLLAGAGGIHAYDSSNEDRIAEGVTAAGVDIGGLTAARARITLEREVADEVERPIAVTRGKDRFTLSAKDAGVRADVGGMVDEALAESRQGNIFTRAARDLTRGEENVHIAARVAHSQEAAAKLVTRVANAVNRPAKDASLDFPDLSQVKERDGVKLDARRLRSEVIAAMTDPDDREVEATTSVVKAKVTQATLADKYPTLMIVDRANFKLRLYKSLKLEDEYPIAVGQVGLETPAGLYHVQNKGENVAWNVPNRDWAGALAGTVVPGGSPDNPLKARWLGIYDGAGIHGTDDVGSLGSAASHGCVRMAIPDVIALYDQVEVQTPIYIA